MAHITNLEQQTSPTPDPSTQWASLRDIVSLVAKENRQPEQQVAAILLSSDINTLRPLLTPIV